ncbi:MAG: hypothetical protein HOK21_17465 [Rhodospirillaceae bacterium]|jgi:hypothetical protein|nr:hypothetical protein [Rhodospirillaceae bacterium]MBT4043527.1 hypothetical protein [Rhodospirillaceae bacterium]MBT4689663.1 hypothetical protein [Rhodospirillaceae bacterium]MBT5079398.1 hypothetical protein [Rhodospirillaceae bacterium]MBT5525873.1 hypothetical protein [Rhodospirillaceae bacterium]
MQHIKSVTFGFILGVAAFGLPSLSAQAAIVELISNGGFETGDFTGWTVNNTGSGGVFVDTPGTTTPTSGHLTSAAGGSAHGSFYAVTDQSGPGAHELSQSFTVAAGATSVLLSFDLFVNDADGGPLFAPGGLADGTSNGPNQHASVDIMASTDAVFQTLGLANFYLGVDAGADPHAFSTITADITALVGGGGTFIFRLGEVDTQSFLNAGIDNVSILADQAVVPIPAALPLFATAIAGLGFAGYRKRKSKVA